MPGYMSIANLQSLRFPNKNFEGAVLSRCSRGALAYSRAGRFHGSMRDSLLPKTTLIRICPESEYGTGFHVVVVVGPQYACNSKAESVREGRPQTFELHDG
jgi:hypothetical protein